MTEIILASSSPRRQSLMKQIGIPFTVKVKDINEESHEQASPADLVRELSGKKATAVLKKLKSNPDKTIIIGADTVVSLSDKIFGKPKDEEDACRMLKELQGRRHEVYTGITLVHAENNKTNIVSFVEKAGVFMRELTDSEIWAYIKTGEPLDKAGAYGIQEKGALWIKRIEGDFYTVMGLPLARLYYELQGLGVEPIKYW